jgi:hypothetical protein
MGFEVLHVRPHPVYCGAMNSHAPMTSRATLDPIWVQRECSLQIDLPPLPLNLDLTRDVIWLYHCPNLKDAIGYLGIAPAFRNAFGQFVDISHDEAG